MAFGPESEIQTSHPNENSFSLKNAKNIVFREFVQKSSEKQAKTNQNHTEIKKILSDFQKRTFIEKFTQFFSYLKENGMNQEKTACLCIKQQSKTFAFP